MFVNLVSILVRWVWGPPPKYKLPLLLRPLELIRRDMPSVTIHLDANSPSSSLELAQGQRSIGDGTIDHWREWIENAIDAVDDREAALSGRHPT